MLCKPLCPAHIPCGPVTEGTLGPSPSRIKPGRNRGFRQSSPSHAPISILPARGPRLEERFTDSAGRSTNQHQQRVCIPDDHGSPPAPGTVAHNRGSKQESLSDLNPRLTTHHQAAPVVQWALLPACCPAFLKAGQQEDANHLLPSSARLSGGRQARAEIPEDSGISRLLSPSPSLLDEPSRNALTKLK